ncbi:hypothetical protein [Fredinandcohnia sp. 179-A 10B2 NHS]|uniref:hypothetical protein n=1 Tax=Fredinandcohnia sp. 179-A 10B2 NHS TaxID=3235176 RepID=UPI0039A2E359
MQQLSTAFVGGPLPPHPGPHQRYPGIQKPTLLLLYIEKPFLLGLFLLKYETQVEKDRAIVKSG